MVVLTWSESINKVRRWAPIRYLTTSLTKQGLPPHYIYTEPALKRVWLDSLPVRDGEKKCSKLSPVHS